jgi:hypothetical protein
MFASGITFMTGFRKNRGTLAYDVSNLLKKTATFRELEEKKNINVYFREMEPPLPPFFAVKFVKVKVRANEKNWFQF